MKNKTTFGYIAIFIAILIGLTLITTLGGQTQEMTTTASVTNESVTIAGGTATLAINDLIALTQFINASSGEVLINNNETIDTRLNVTLATGVIVTSLTNGGYYASYTYYPDNYIKNASSRSLTDLIVIFFIIALIAVGVGGIYQSGLLDEK